MAALRVAAGPKRPVAQAFLRVLVEQHRQECLCHRQAPPVNLGVADH
jgi:hypothetical protein